MAPTDMRTFLVVLFLFLGGVLSLAANLGLWVDRTVYDTDGFVSTVDDVLDDEDVQLVIAERFTQALFEGADIQDRLREELPEGLKFLALPLTRAARDFLEEASLRLMERQPFEDQRNRALEETHSLLISIIEDESGTITTEEGELVIDLRPILEAVAEDVTGRDVEIPEEITPPDVQERLPQGVQERLGGEEGLLAGLELPEDAGRFVIEDKAISWSYRVARYGNDIVYAITGASVACFALAIAVSRDRRSALRTTGIILAVSGTLALAALLPLRQAAQTFAENDAAATSILSILTGGYKAQSLTMIGVGMAVAGVAVLLGDSPLAVSVRSMVRRRPDAPSLLAAIRERVAVLRISGLVGAALLLIVWPDPTPRVYATMLVLLGLYLGSLALIESDAPWAQSTRLRLGDLWRRYVVSSAEGEAARERSIAGWAAAHAGWLRAGGIALAILLLIAWPSLSLGSFIAVVALTLVYLAGVDLIAGRRQGP